ncbi:hypothetical protein [Anaerococcus lactolyticus]|uniref:Uncharacterized protein n=2 Tax=Anaerococcus lactolyticus TaxID=33032 RepID=C2BGU5_9FIRM|nr:hypothetical protein [Anaerococcus lactolyticus]EEI85808.1 hypothetical protein HMPREF0072_1565 [Anaerococcus lactolyticus ATCC 51172]KGF03853.1 hypothetical protein HMPREF1630_05950 [Anaerococcus lactolyticus S7-1-13]
MIDIIKNMFMPIFTVVAVISLINFLVDGRKLSIYVSVVTGFIAAILLVVSVINPNSDLFMQLYLLLFLLSISLVILALQKQIDAFTWIGIALMVVMLYLLLRFPLI